MGHFAVSGGGSGFGGDKRKVSFCFSGAGGDQSDRRFRESVCYVMYVYLLPVMCNCTSFIFNNNKYKRLALI